MIKTSILFLCFLFLNLGVIQAQDDAVRHNPSLTVGVSALKFNGDVGRLSDLSPMLDLRLGYYVAIEQRFGKILGVSLGGMYGKLAGTDHKEISYLNFEANVMQTELMFTANFDKVIKNDPAVSPFINVGIGYMLYTTNTDLKNGNVGYNYWSDGSIRDLPELPSSNQIFANTIKRDYIYETKIFSKACIVLPMGGGLNFHMGERWTSSIGVNYVYALTDAIDNKTKGDADSYLQANVGLQFEFKKKSKTQSANFDLVDNLDVDGDGVPDNRDNCLGTPIGVLVDTHGCPFDMDEDGVPDYMDKEPKTQKGVKVDGAGVTLNEDEMARHQLEWDSLAAVRSGGFNENPSLDYLKQVEAKGKEINKGKQNKIPEDFRSADINNDGYISADEITKTIDGFFEGINDYTVEKINQLIDFFFEQ